MSNRHKLHPRGKVLDKVSQTSGDVVTINSQSIRVLKRDPSGDVSECSGTVTVTDGGAGYAKGCKYTKTDGSAGSVVFINEGSNTSCDFNAVETAANLITGVTAGAGLTGTATEGTATLDVGEGTGIAVSADAVSVDEGYLRVASVELAAADILDLADTPFELVAAPGAGEVIEFVSAVLLLDHSGTGFTEDGDNLEIHYENEAGAAVSEAIEMTGFIDQTADTVTTARAKANQIVAKTGCENKALVLVNINDEFADGGTTASVLRVITTYRVHATGF